MWKGYTCLWLVWHQIKNNCLVWNTITSKAIHLAFRISNHTRDSKLLKKRCLLFQSLPTMNRFYLVVMGFFLFSSLFTSALSWSCLAKTLSLLKRSLGLFALCTLLLTKELCWFKVWLTFITMDRYSSWSSVYWWYHLDLWNPLFEIYQIIWTYCAYLDFSISICDDYYTNCLLIWALKFRVAL